MNSNAEVVRGFARARAPRMAEGGAPTLARPTYKHVGLRLDKATYLCWERAFDQWRADIGFGTFSDFVRSCVNKQIDRMEGARAAAPGAMAAMADLKAVKR